MIHQKSCNDFVSSPPWGQITLFFLEFRIFPVESGCSSDYLDHFRCSGRSKFSGGVFRFCLGALPEGLRTAQIALRSQPARPCPTYATAKPQCSSRAMPAKPGRAIRARLAIASRRAVDGRLVATQSHATRPRRADLRGKRHARQAEPTRAA